MLPILCNFLLLALILPAALTAAETPTPPRLVSTQDDFVFFLCGDNRGGDNVYTQILTHASARHAAFLLNTGDMVPEDSAENWKHFEQIMRLCTVPFFPVAGNHDCRGGSLENFVRWTPSHAEHYSFDYGQLHFTMANDSIDMTAGELAWIDADLKASAKPIKIVVHHHPAWNPSGRVYGMTENRQEFLDALKKHGVRYDFCGHDHGYRSGITNGCTLIITGGAGAPLYHPTEEGGFNHYVEFTVKGTNVTFKVVQITP